MLPHRCPTCRGEIEGKIADGAQVRCRGCKRRFQVSHREFSGKTRLMPLDVAAVQPPLGLPRGSIRALVTLAVAASCWVLMIGDQPVPHYLLNLLLAIVGYYFGFRQKTAAANPATEAYVRAPEPLHLPGGSIRTILILGFVISALAVGLHGRMIDLAHLEFFLLLAGLVAGYFFSRMFRAADAGTCSRVNHLKGLAAVMAAGWLAVGLWSGAYLKQPHLGLIPACIITFYFGSRSGEPATPMGRIDHDTDRLRLLRQDRRPMKTA